MYIAEVFTNYLDNHRTPEYFAMTRDITGTKRSACSRSAASLVEEVFMRMPKGIDSIEIRHGESMMLKELFEQIVIDLIDIEDLELWQKCRTEGLERLSNMINSIATVNLLLNR